MHNPGDLACVRQNTLVKRWLTEEESWTRRLELCLVISTGTSHRLVDEDGDCVARVLVLTAEGMYIVPESGLYTLDQVADPSRLFPPTRLREW